MPPPECYLQRGLAFRPRDATLYVLFGLYMQKLDKLKEAEKFYLKSIKLNPLMSESFYNLGLLYVEQGQYEKAKDAAIRAYRLKYPLTGLKRKLAKAGYPID